MGNDTRMEALHETGSIIRVDNRRNLRMLKLMSECGYTHVRMVTWGWEPIATAIKSASKGNHGEA